MGGGSSLNTHRESTWGQCNHSSLSLSLPLSLSLSFSLSLSLCILFHFISPILSLSSSLAPLSSLLADPAPVRSSLPPEQAWRKQVGPVQCVPLYSALPPADQQKVPEPALPPWNTCIIKYLTFKQLHHQKIAPSNICTLKLDICTLKSNVCTLRSNSCTIK